MFVQLILTGIQYAEELLNINAYINHHVVSTNILYFGPSNLWDEKWRARWTYRTEEMTHWLQRRKNLILFGVLDIMCILAYS